MSRNCRRMLLIACLSMELSCAAKLVHISPIASLAKDSTLSIIGPAEAGVSLAAVQQIEIIYPQTVHSFSAQIEISSSRLALVGFSSFGPRAFTLIYENELLYSERHRPIKLGFEPLSVLRDIELSCWPIAAVTKHLSPQIRVEECLAPKHIRSFFKDNKQIIRVSYEELRCFDGPTLFENLEKGYVVRMRTKVTAE